MIENTKLDSAERADLLSLLVISQLIDTPARQFGGSSSLLLNAHPPSRELLEEPFVDESGVWNCQHVVRVS